MKILGISFSHDSGASLVIDGYLKFAINEERLSRKKLHVGYPQLSINKLLSETNLKISDLDIITIDGKKLILKILGKNLILKIFKKLFLDL